MQLKIFLYSHSTFLYSPKSSLFDCSLLRNVPYCPSNALFMRVLRFFSLFKLANKSLSLYIFVSVLWFYLVLYMFHCPKSIDCTERCYQFVIKFLLSVKDSCDILISVDHTIDFFIFDAYFIDNHVIFPYRIFIICPKADSFGKI